MKGYQNFEVYLPKERSVGGRIILTAGSLGFVIKEDGVAFLYSRLCLLGDQHSLQGTSIPKKIGTLVEKDSEEFHLVHENDMVLEGFVEVFTG